MKDNGLPPAGSVKLNDLYQEVILDHNKRPRNYQKLEQATGYAHGVNPLCGDDFEIYLVREGDRISRIGFQGQGCAISKASASLMTTAIEGKTLKEAQALKDHFIRLLTESAPGEEARQGVGKLKFFEGVKQFPIRVKCATLSWRALEEALKEKSGSGAVTTEDDAQRRHQAS